MDSKFPNPPSWNEYFMRHVYLVASKSKDRRTKVGSVIVKNNRIIASGYNGFPVGVNDDVHERRERPTKYLYVVHSEYNSVLQCALEGISPSGGKLITNGIPCCECAKSIIQSGIKSVVVHKQWVDFEKKLSYDKWVKSKEVTEIMFGESGVAIDVFDGFLGVLAYLDGKIIKV